MKLVIVFVGIYVYKKKIIVIRICKYLMYYYDMIVINGLEVK